MSELGKALEKAKQLSQRVSYDDLYRMGTSYLGLPRQVMVDVVNRVRGAVRDLVMEDQAVVQALSEITASGTFMVEVDPELHERLIGEALRQGISLNELAAQRLAASPSTPLRSAEEIVGEALTRVDRTIESAWTAATNWFRR
ncbi:toxin-antitoxin system HicB family antitoxin [Nocardia nepalensis]|uniref:toxin-antitoxin system HicB family antitoxin n=1 Tax=Nocardia nepalensis TaxID=3375448 RepID=UPI003B66DEB6